MIQNVTDIIVAAAAVFGLVPLGVKTVVDMIKNRRHKKNADMWTTVLVSVVAANLAPPVLTELFQRLGAAAEQLPPPLKALLGAIPQQPPGQAAAGAPDAQTAPPADARTAPLGSESPQDGRVPSPG